MATWTIPFYNRDNDYIVVKIHGTKQDKQLTPAEHPFMTQGDDDVDFFKPVRTETGYIRIICHLGEIDELFNSTPLEHPVTAEKNGAIVWYGHLQQDAFTQPFKSTLVQVELPVQNALKTLEGVEMLHNTAPQELCDFLIEMCNQCGMQVKYFYFPDNTTQEDTFRTVIQRENWVEYNDTPDADDSYVSYAKYSEIIEDICKVWGWQLQQVGNDLYFTQRDTDKTLYRRIDAHDMDQMHGQYYTTVRTLNEEIKVGGSNHSITLNRGKRSITVNGKFGQEMKEVYSLNPESLHYSRMYRGTKSYIWGMGNQDRVLRTANGHQELPMLYQLARGASGVFGSDLETYMFDSYQDKNHGIIIVPGGSVGYHVQLITSQEVNTYDLGTYLSINGKLKVMRSLDEGFVEPGQNESLSAKIVYGNYKLTTGEWNTNVPGRPGTFLKFASDGSPVGFTNIQKPVIHHPLNEYPKGAIVRLPSGVTSTITIELTYNSGTGYIALMIEDFSVSLYRNKSVHGALDDKHSEHSFVGDGNTEDYSIDFNLSCCKPGDYENKGVGTLYSYLSDVQSHEWEFVDEKEFGQPPYTLDGVNTPEVSMLNRAVNYYSTSYASIDVKSESSEPFTPLVTFPVMGNLFIQVAQELDWIDCTNKLTLIQLK